MSVEKRILVSSGSRDIPPGANAKSAHQTRKREPPSSNVFGFHFTRRVGLACKNHKHVFSHLLVGANLWRQEGPASTEVVTARFRFKPITPRASAANIFAWLASTDG